MAITFTQWIDQTFQSTLSMRRATRKEWGDVREGLISIHALHEESDVTVTVFVTVIPAFQSTLSMRRATLWKHISIVSRA